MYVLYNYILDKPMFFIKDKVGSGGNVAVENFERVKMGNHTQSSFNKVLLFHVLALLCATEKIFYFG